MRMVKLFDIVFCRNLKSTGEVGEEDSGVNDSPKWETTAIGLKATEWGNVWLRAGTRAGCDA